LMDPYGQIWEGATHRYHITSERLTRQQFTSYNNTY